MNKAELIARLMATALAATALLTACATSPPPRATVVRTPPSMFRSFPSSIPYYPVAAARLGESGRVTVRACVGVDGKLTSAPTVAASSGSPRLDDGALRLAQAGSGHYRPATENGRPVSSCFLFGVNFALKDVAAKESPAAAPGTQGAPNPDR